jgi:hypothetical protein
VVVRIALDYVRFVSIIVMILAKHVYVVAGRCSIEPGRQWRQLKRKKEAEQ